MSYRIGSVAEMLDMPVETIRFYENQGIVKPRRLENSNYREYETWDLFQLMECVRFRGMGFSVKETADVINKESLKSFRSLLVREKTKTEKRISRDRLLLEYLRDYHERVETAADNLGNYWFRAEPVKKYFFFTEETNEEYEDIRNQPLVTEWLGYSPFVEFCQHISLASLRSGRMRSESKWSFMIDTRYADYLGARETEEIHLLDRGLCLHSVIDAGEKGEMSLDMVRPTLEFLEGKPYEIIGDAVGTLLVRVHQSGKLARFIEIRIPVKRK